MARPNEKKKKNPTFKVSKVLSCQEVSPALVYRDVYRLLHRRRKMKAWHELYFVAEKFASTQQEKDQLSTLGRRALIPLEDDHVTPVIPDSPQQDEAN